MSIVDSRVLRNTELDMLKAMKRYTANIPLPDDKLVEYAQTAVKEIDWNNAALMHKGINWIAQRFLSRNGVLA